VQVGGLRFFDDAVRVVALRRVEYPAIASQNAMCVAPASSP
jgi:hypothetical protein